MAQLEDIQQTELELLTEIKRLCDENELTYIIAYGTMLGAVRHHGFIPWDDDTDIYMPLRDLLKLDKHLNINKYFLQTEKSDPQMPFVFYKLRKNGTKMLQPEFEKLNIHQGIWVDIFPYVNAAKWTFFRKKQYSLLMLLQGIRMRSANKVNGKKNVKAKIIGLTPSFLIRAVDSVIVRCISLIGSKSSDCYFVFFNERIEKLFIKRDWFDSLDNYDFENLKVKGVREYDAYLQRLYGKNYMIPKQYSHFSDYSSVIV